MKRFLSLLAAALLMLSLTACGKSDTQQPQNNTASAPSQPADSNLVGICVPNATDPRWAAEAAALSQLLEKAGLSLTVQYAQDDALLQATQIQDMIAESVCCLVIAAVDSLALAEVLQQAKQAGIPVIAYDRLLMHTDAVSCYVGYDYQAIGTAIANHIVKAKQLETAQAESRSHTIELFMGSPENNNAVLLYAGIQQVLQSYLDCGVLVCLSGRTAFEDVYIQNWSSQLAKTHCETYLASCYTEAPPEIVCAATDEIADGCISALESFAFISNENWPLITGQGATETAIQRLASGKQSMTVQKELKDLPEACFAAITAALDKTDADWDGPVCNNGSVSVPARYCEFTLVEAPIVP